MLRKSVILPSRMIRALLPKHVAAALRSQTDPLRALQMFDELPRREGFAHTPSTFTAMVKKLASHGQFAEMEKLLAQMRAAFGDAAAVAEPAHVCAIRGYGRRGKVQEAADMFERMDLFGIQPSVVSYNSIMDVLVEHGFFDQAHKVYLRMLHHGISPDLCTFAVRIKAFRFTRRPLAALRLLRGMPARGFCPNSLVYCSVVASLYEGLFLDNALALFDEMLQMGLLPEILVFNKLAHALCNLGGSGGGGGREATRLLCKILKRGTSPNLFTFNILLRSLCRDGRLTEAAALLQRRLDDGGAADVVSFNTVIAGLCQGSRVGEAAEYLRRMTNGGCFPDSFTYNTLIDGFCRSGMILQARQLLQDAIFKGFSPDRFTYGSLVNGFCESGDLTAAAAAVREASTVGLPPDTAVCNSLIKGLCRHGHLPQALELAAEMAEDHRADAYTYNIIIHSLCRAGQITEAQALINSAMADSSFLPDVFTFNSLVDGLCRCRQLDEALDIIRRMESSHGVRPDAVTYNCILDGLCKSGKTAEVEQTFKDMAAGGCPPNVVSCNILIQTLCKTRRAGEAVDLLRRMRDRDEGLPVPDAVSYSTVIYGLCSASEIGQALEHFRELEKEGYGASEMASAYSMLIAAFAGRREPGAAAELLAEMERRGCAPDGFAFRELVGGFCRIGDSARALELLKKMMRVAVVGAAAMAETCGRVINCLCMDQRAEEAVELVREMVSNSSAPPAAAAIFDTDKRAAAAPKILIEELLKNGHITYHAYEILYDGVRTKNLTRRRR